MNVDEALKIMGRREDKPPMDGDTRMIVWIVGIIVTGIVTIVLGIMVYMYHDKPELSGCPEGTARVEFQSGSSSWSDCLPYILTIEGR